MIKTVRKIGIKGNFLNLTKRIYKKPIANITLNHETLNVFLLDQNKARLSSLTALLFNIVLKVLVSALRPKKGGEGNKGIQNRKNKIRWHDCLCKILPRNLQKPPKTKWVQQGLSMQHKHTKINYIYTCDEHINMGIKNITSIAIFQKIKRLNVNLLKSCMELNMLKTTQYQLKKSKKS